MARIPEESEKRLSIKFQKRLSEFIKEEECTNVEFAKRVGVCKEVILRAVCYGILPSVKSLIKLADYLNVSIPYLLGESDLEIFYKTETPTTFHKRIEELRIENNTKYSAIVKKMPFPRNSFYEWLRLGTLPSLEYLEYIATYFNVSVDFLIHGKEFQAK